MNAIVIAARGLPAGWLGAYGNEWVVTPELDRLAAEGVVFDRHLSDNPDPAAAGRAWLGGGLLDRLRAAGVCTVLVRANHPDTDGPPSFYAGWAEVFDARPVADDDTPLDQLIRELPARLDRLPAPFLLWVETDRLVPPWDVRQDVFDAYLDEGDEDDPPAEAEDVSPFADPPTGPFDRSDPAALDFLHRSFAAVVTAFDAEVGRMAEAFRARGLDRAAAWLVTADRGYPLGDHGQVGPYRPWLHQAVVQVPLLLRLPDAAEAGRRVAALTQPADLPPTLLALFGVPRESGAGFDLLPLARGGAESVREYAVTEWEVNGVTERAIHTADRTLIAPGPQPDGETRAPQLYEKPGDRWEVNDLRPREVDAADELEAVLRSHVAEHGGEHEPERQHPGGGE